jgi:hypothetical protein
MSFILKQLELYNKYKYMNNVEFAYYIVQRITVTVAYRLICIQDTIEPASLFLLFKFSCHLQHFFQVPSISLYS